MMAYFAELKNNLVQTVIVVSNEIDNGAEWCVETYGGEWVETFIDDPDKTYAGIGYLYSYATQDFTAPPQPEPKPEPEPIE